MNALQIKEKDNVGLGWNVKCDGSVILQIYGESEQSQIICFPAHIQIAFENLARLEMRKTSPRSRKAQIYNEIIKLMSELREMNKAGEKMPQ